MSLNCFQYRRWNTNDRKLLAIALTALICALAEKGVGRHVVNVPFSNSYWIQVLGFCIRCIHIVVLTTTKLSVCLFYRRIFQDPLSNILSVSLMAFMTAFTIALFIDGFFACDLGGAYWSPVGPKCVSTSFGQNLGFFVYGSATLSVGVDLFLMAFAVWKVFPLPIARGQKLSLYTIISLGWLAIIASIIRAVRTGQTFASRDPTCMKQSLSSCSHIADSDFVGAAFAINVWASVEVNTGLVCASAPALKPLVRKLLPSFLASTPDCGSGVNNVASLNLHGYLQTVSHSTQNEAMEPNRGRPIKSDTTVTQLRLPSEDSGTARIDEQAFSGRMKDVESRSDVLFQDHTC